MLHTIFLISLYFSTSLLSVSSLNCYYCKDVIVVNYTVTSDRVPSFSDCDVVNTTQCSISLTWNIHNDTSAIVVGDRRDVSIKDPAQDTVMGIVFMDIGPDKITPLLAHNLYFSCSTGDKCNDEDGLKKMIRSITIQDQFRQELAELIKIVPSFDPRSAGCEDFHSAVGYCPPKDLNNCQRCTINVDQILTLDKQICATCPQHSINTNLVMHSTMFYMKDHSQISDHAQINCQLRGCNSMDNINRVYKASKIGFNFDEYFKN